MKEIRMKHGGIAKVAKKLGHNRDHVSDCLKGVVDTDLAKKIRKTAIKMGGFEVNN